MVLSGTPGLFVEEDGGLSLDDAALQAEMARFKNHDVKTLIALIEDAELHPVAFEDIEEAAVAVGIRSLRLPIADFHAPTAEQEADWAEIRGHARQVLAEGGSVAFFCLAGIGRSGMMAACLLVHLGLTPEDALSEVRRIRPDALETDAQLAYLRAQ